MYPDQPQNNPYDFITNPMQPGSSNVGGGSVKGRIIKASSIGLGIIFAGIIVWTIIGALTGEKFDDLVKVANTQKKIIYIAELEAESGQSSTARAFAATLVASVKSDNQSLGSYFDKRGRDADAKRIISGEDEDVKADFDNALKGGRADDFFYKTVSELLEDYKDDLKAASTDAKQKTEKDLLQNATADIVIFAKAWPV